MFENRNLFFFDKNKIDLVKNMNLPFKTFQNHHKSIPDKIIHRNDDPTFFSTLCFSLKKKEKKRKEKKRKKYISQKTINEK